MRSVKKNKTWLVCLLLTCMGVDSTGGSPSQDVFEQANRILLSPPKTRSPHTLSTINLYLSHLSANGRSSNTKSLDTSRIAGGYKAPASTFVHVAYVSLTVSSGASYSCSGSILNSETILTAAHCFLNDDGEIDVDSAYIRIGKRSNRGTKHLAKFIDIYKDYNIATFRHDIALVTLLKPLKGKYQKIQFPKCSRCFPRPGMEVFAAGFGIIDNEERETDILLQTRLAVQNFALCKKTYNKIVVRSDRVRFGTHHMFCATDENFPDAAERAVCVGDSGGPVFIKDGKFGFVQLGITSFGSADCLKKGAVDWFVNLSRYQTDITNFLRGRRNRWTTVYTHPDA